MKRLSILLSVLLPVGAYAAEPVKNFEVASVKPAAPSAIGPSFHTKTGARFGPGTSDATRWACDNCSLGVLLSEAYNLKRFQITGPKWLDSERFDVVAQVAEGATKDDLRLMEQALLAERFGLKVHFEKKEMQVYDLVAAKGSLKLKETAGAKPVDGAATHEFGHGGGGGGFQHDAASGQTFTITMHGNTKHQAVGEDMRQLSDFLAAQLDRPVTDSTGLTGKYDFVLAFSGAKGSDMSPMGAIAHGGPAGGHADGPDTETPPLLQKAIQDQLGLRLEAKKGVAEILIVDHIERVAAEN